MQLTDRTRLAIAALGALTLFAAHLPATTITPAVFATGAPISSTSPDSIVFGDGSLWVSYQNNAASTGGSGSSTIARYSVAGSLINTWTIAGNVDGLRIDPSGQVWALQNNDANSALTVINPVTNATTAYTYGSTYTANGNSLSRGFDDAEFLNGNVYLSETNPASGSDPVIVRLTTSLTSPLEVSGILNSTFTGTNLATGALQSTTVTDSDSLILGPAGELVLTGEADQEIVFVHNPGAANQSESFLALLGANGQTISGFPDDTVFPASANGTFYVSDTGANTVYALTATGLVPGSVYIDVGDEFGSLDTSTGVVTPIFTGVSPHGVAFVPTPEPASSFLGGGGLLLLAAAVSLKNRRKTAFKKQSA